VQGNLGLQLNRQWQLKGHYGDEDNDFYTVYDKTGGDFWQAGLRWTPNDRTEVEAGTGHRFFGDTPYASVSHRHKRSRFGFAYERELTFARDIREWEDILPEADESGEPINPLDLQPLAGASNATTLTDSPILDKRYTLDYAYQGRLSTLRLYLSQSDQTRADDGSESQFRRASVSLDRELGRSVRVFGAVGWNESKPKSELNDFRADTETWTGVLGLERSLSRQLTLTCDYRYTDQSSDRESDEYKENRVTLLLMYAFR
jgi:uncharacterized protein (PEP-CTERM system associated)